MAYCRLQILAPLCLASVVSSVSIRRALSRSLVSDIPEWQQNVSHVLEVEGIEHPETQTAIVTFAGKRDLSYIDGAIMLGKSIQKHVPGYPMVAIVIEAMKVSYQHLLESAGWTLVVVPNWDYEYCGVDCDTTFLGRWHDSFEKINTFRLPFRRVLFLDSDTYIFSSRLQEMITTELPDGHIAMAKDGCKDEYNSGVMFYQPDLEVFKDMLVMVTNRKREKILDQELVNSAYENKVVEFPREFNCVDTLGIQPGQKKACDFHCSANVVVAHFTGHPKPTSAKRRLLEVIRRPGSPEISCTNTNFGSCAKWSEYYCDIREMRENVSRDLKHALKKTGFCCHGETANKESCKECPALLTVSGSKKLGNPAQDIDGTYAKTNIKPVQFNGGKPIYVMPASVKAGKPKYLYYSQKNVMWFIGHKYDSNLFADFIAYAGKEAQCPRDAGAWQFQVRGEMRIWGLATRAAPKPPDAPSDTDRIVWNIETQKWEREEAGHVVQVSFDDDEDSNDNAEEKEAAEEAEKKRERLAAEAASAKRLEEERNDKGLGEEGGRKAAEDAEKKRLAGEDAEAKRLEEENKKKEEDERKVAEAVKTNVKPVDLMSLTKLKEEDGGKAAEASAKDSSKDAVSEDDGPGTYRVISAGPRLDALPVSKDYERTSAKVGEVAVQQEVNVLEVAAELNDGRRRARIANPAGWITLKATKSGFRFAVKQSDVGDNNVVPSSSASSSLSSFSSSSATVHSVALDDKASLWIKANAKNLSVDHLRLDKKPEDLTALVTFAGQKKTEYLDAAVMLAHSLKKHAPGYPLVAIAIEGMKSEHQKQLENAGWQLVFVENWEDEYCRQDCNQEFMKRWHDSFEKINIFRLGFGKVVFFDADTYVFSPRVKQLLTGTRLKKGHIAMAPDGCKDEYNSGVMVFRPDVEIFRFMLGLVVTRKREQILDQNIINAAYAGRITELDREFNCVDIMGVQPGMSEECSHKCSANVVVAHFTGHPKPTAAKRRLLAMVRRPESPQTTCKNTNFGSCKQWSQYYCDIRAHKKTLSKNLQGWLKGTGECCHTPFDPKTDDESCKDCPSQLRITGGAPFPAAATGSFMKSSVEPTKYNGGKPIYVKAGTEDAPVYLYYVQKQVLWMIGSNHQNNSPYAFAQVDATCPRDVGKWNIMVSGQWSWVKDVLVKTEDLANGTQAPMLWDIDRRAWVPDHGKHATFEDDFE